MTHKHTTFPAVMSFKSVVVVMSVFTLGEPKLRPLEIDLVDTRVSLSECVLEAGRKFFGNGSFQTITYSLPPTELANEINSVATMASILLPLLENESKWSVIVNKNSKLSLGKIEEVKITLPSIYLVQIRAKGDIEDTIRHLSQVKWNPHAQFLVISPVIFPRPEEIAKEVTRVLWRYKVSKAAVLLTNLETVTKFDVYSLNPYSNKNCGKPFVKTHSSNSCTFGALENENNWFRPVDRGELHGCYVDVLYQRWPPYVLNTVGRVFQTSDPYIDQGIEINLMNMIAQKLELGIRYQPGNSSGWGNIRDGNATGDLERLQMNEVDVVVGGYAKNYQRCSRFDCSRVYLQEKFEWCVPHSPVPIGLHAMAKILSVAVWSCVIVSYFAFTWCMYYITNRNWEASHFKSFADWSLTNYSILIGFATKLPASTLIRYLIGLLTILSLNLNTAYISYLTSLLSRPKMEKYNKIEYTYEYHLDTYFLPNTRQFYGTSNGMYYKQPAKIFFKKWRNCYNSTICLENIIQYKNSSFCIPKLHKEYLLSNIEYLRKERRSIYCLEDKLKLHVNIIMRKGFPLYKLVDGIIDGAISGGFIAKWQKDILAGKLKANTYDEDYVTENMIKFTSLVPIFELLVFGLTIASAVFLIEIVWYRRTAGKK